MKTAILFPPLMKLKKNDYKDFYKEFPEVRKKFTEASEILGFNLEEKFYSDDEDIINEGVVARCGTVTICSAVHEMVKDTLPKADYYLGPSLGLINSIHCSGRMSFEDTLRMVKAMVDIETSEFPDNRYGVYFFYNIDTNLLLEYMEEFRQQGGTLEPIMFGNSTQMIVNGDFDSLEKLSTKAATQGGLGVIVPYGPPSHCRLMENVERRYINEYAPSVAIKEVDMPLLSNVTGKEITSSAEIKEELIKQYTNPVQWYGSLKYIYRQGVEKVIVIGPGQFITKSLNFTDIPFQAEHLVTTDAIKNKLAVRT